MNKPKRASRHHPMRCRRASSESAAGLATASPGDAGISAASGSGDNTASNVASIGRPGAAANLYRVIGVMRMNSCIGKVVDEPEIVEDEIDINWRKSVWFKEWAEHDPVEQHWHLGPIGVLPSHRGRGVGTELMKRFCKEVDNCSAKAYLETDLYENVRFYEKFGFKVISRSDIFNVENRYMVRD